MYHIFSFFSFLRDSFKGDLNSVQFVVNLVYKSSTLNKALIPRILKLIIFFNISEYPVDNNDYNEISLTSYDFFFK